MDYSSIFILDKSAYVKIPVNQILLAEADGAYVKIISANKHYQLTTNLKTVQDQIKIPDLIRVSRKHLVNKNHISKICGNTLYLSLGDSAELAVTMSKALRREILSQFQIIKTK